MCGIVGYFFQKNDSRFLRINDALKWMAHRGPDGQGTWSDDDAGLAHVRLSVIDLEGGKQPMVTTDGHFVLVYNGEIYNFHEIKIELEASGEKFKTSSDAEVLLRLFARTGLEKTLKKLRGMFAFAVWDSQEKILYLARDRIGVKPLVYAETEFGFLFASEIGALFKLFPDLPRTVDYTALNYYLTFNFISAPLTAFSSIRKLPPAHFMVIRNGKIQKINRYWDIDFSSKERISSFPEACEALRENFLEATKIRMISDVPLGAFLSGGIDSSITVAAMARLSDKPIKTFSVGFDHQELNELPYARKIAKHLGTDHHEILLRADPCSSIENIIDHFGEPMGDHSAIPTIALCKATRQNVTVALTGDGADEIFAGYKNFYKLALIDNIEKYNLIGFWRHIRKTTFFLENRFGRKKRHQGFPSTKADQILYMTGIDRYKHLNSSITDYLRPSLLTDTFQEKTYEDYSKLFLESIYDRSKKTDIINRYLFLHMNSYLPGDILVKLDICSMLSSLECRSPFLDHKLIEFVFSLPGHYKLKHFKKYKYILKECFKGWLPPGFMKRRKMGFSAPLSQWLRKEYAPLINERLIVEKQLSPWINQKALSKIVKEHMTGEKNNRKIIWSLLIMAEWKVRYNPQF